MQKKNNKNAKNNAKTQKHRKNLKNSAKKPKTVLTQKRPFSGHSRLTNFHVFRECPENGLFCVWTVFDITKILNFFIFSNFSYFKLI